MSEVDSHFVRKGFWVDHDAGRVLGATITTDQKISNVLVALIAIVISVAASSAWNLLLFAVHQYRATDKPRDALFRQQQILLRSMASPATFVVDSIKMFFVWRMESVSAALRCLLPAAIAFIFAVATVAAGVFSSYIMSTVNLQVLVDSPACQDLNITAYLTTPTTDIDINLFDTAASYLDECYKSGPLPSKCNFYVHPRIQPTVADEECPFDSSMCLVPDAVVLDTGYLDSNEVFGINAAPNDRVQLRRKTTCAPLDVKNHISLLNASEPALIAWLGREPGPEELLWVLEYGHESFVSKTGSENGTFFHSNVNANGTDSYGTGGVCAFGSAPLAEYSSFHPIDELQRDDADVTLIPVFTNAVGSPVPIDDPVYSAHQTRPGLDGGPNGEMIPTTWYIGDHAAGMLGCASQYQYCLGSGANMKCTPLQGATFSNFDNLLPSANAKQLATLTQLGQGTFMAAQVFVPPRLSPDFLNSSSQVLGGTVNGLPANQWAFDVQKMESFVLSWLQNFMLSHAVGYSTSAEESAVLLTSPSTTAEKDFCQMQKVVKPGGFANINVFGLIFTLHIWALLAILDYGVLRILVLRCDFCEGSATNFRLRCWFEDGMYQLQRATYEAYTDTLWGCTNNEMPVAAKGEMLRNLEAYKSASGHGLVTEKSIRGSRPTTARTSEKGSVRDHTAECGTPVSEVSLSSSSTTDTEVPIPPPWTSPSEANFSKV